MSATASTNSCLVTFDPPCRLVSDRDPPPEPIAHTDSAQPCGFIAALSRRKQVARTVERGEPHAEPGEGVRATLLPVDDAHRVADDETGCANGLHRLAEGAARRDDVLDEAHELARLVRPFDAVPGAVFLGFTAHDDEGQPGRHGRRGGQRDGSERRPGEPDGVRLDLAHGAGEPLAELAQQRRDRSRSGTCRGTSASACPSGG